MEKDSDGSGLYGPENNGPLLHYPAIVLDHFTNETFSADALECGMSTPTSGGQVFGMLSPVSRGGWRYARPMARKQ